MNDEDGIYPRTPELESDRRAAIRSTVLAAVTSDERHGRPWFAMSRGRLAVAIPIAALLALVSMINPFGPATAPTWAAVPDAVDAATMAQLGSQCASAIADAHFPISIASATPVLAERRGSSSAVLLVSPSQIQECVVDKRGELDSLGVYDVEPLAATDDGVVDGSSGSSQGGMPLRVIFGRIQPTYGKVSVMTADGRAVTASVVVVGSTGYFLAWWPSNADARTVEVTKPADGVVHQLEVPLSSPVVPTHR